jgi:hypothetical protein
MYPVNTFDSQAPCEVYFGVGPSTQVDRLTIRWPSGLLQELSHVSADQHLRVTEGGSAKSVASVSAQDGSAE